MKRMMMNMFMKNKDRDKDRNLFIKIREEKGN